MYWCGGGLVSHACDSHRRAVRGSVGRMSDPIVTLATCADFPDLDDDDRGLPDALRARGIEPRVAVWNDPGVEWGVPMIPTTWLEPEAGYSKHQVHTRFPAHGDFVVKPAISSGGRGTGRYTATDASSRSAAINDAMHHLRRGRTVMVQRYLEEVDRKGEVSLVYFNGVLSHAVEKAPMLHPSFKSTDQIHEEIVTAREPSEQEWLWGERVRKAIHTLIKEVSGRDMQLLFNRVDVVGDGQGGFYLMEVSLIDAGLYLGAAPEALDNFADAIAQRIFW